MISNSIDIPLKVQNGASYDVIVCGGGPSGVPAALAARRAGFRTLLIEQTGQLGGSGTSAGVSHLLGGRSIDNSRWAVGGIFLEIVNALAERGGAISPVDIHPEQDKASPFGFFPGKGCLASGVPFDPIAMVSLLDQKMIEAGVDVLYFTSFVDAIIENEVITNIIIHNKSGLQSISCRAVIDATGDADVAARSGCATTKGRPEDSLMAPATLMFHVDQVESEELLGAMDESKSYRFRELISRLRQTGEWPFAYDIFIGVQLNEPGTYMINTTRICDVDGTDGKSVTRGMMQGRAELHQLFGIMRKYFPGFGNARIRHVAPVLGIRETRRIVGDFVYTVADVVSERRFDDIIGYSAYGWDLPDPKRPSYQPLHAAKKSIGDHTAIPYRVMIPRPILNLICPGRSISVERDVLGPLREQGPCYAMGEAAGLATVQVVREGKAFHEIDIQTLRSSIANAGGIVDWI